MQYFALNPMIGYGAYARPDFPRAKDLLAHLDYLSIDRCLVSSIEARDATPLHGNRKLLEEIAPWQERLYPAFVITPADFFIEASRQWLLEQARAGRKAFRVCPAISRFPLRQIERLLAELAPCQPLLLLDFRGSNDPLLFRDLEYLAQKYPSVNFVLCQHMWPSFGAILDVLWRCRNIFLDISWLHMRQAIELVKEHFGCERLLFGIGYKTHYGAAIGALAHAQLTAAEREMIAHGNLERLLQLPPLNRKLASDSPLLARKPLWDAFRRGMPLSLPVIDAHTHDCAANRGWYNRDIEPGRMLSAMLPDMDKHGVDRIILSSEQALFSEPVDGNRALEKEARKFPGRFSGYFVFNPLYEEKITVPVLDKFFRREFFVGFKLLPAYWAIPLTDPRYCRVWEYADRYALPILIHTWGDAAALTEIAPKYPRAAFLLGHSGGSDGGRRQCETIAAAASNTYFEFCGTFCSTLPWQDSIARFGSKRFVFGSDFAAHNQAWELSCFLSIPLPDKVLQPILGQNIQRLLQRRQTSVSPN